MGASSSEATKRAEIGDVPAHWLVAPLSTFVSRVTYGFTNPMPTTDDGPFMVTAKDIHDGRIDYSTARHTSGDAYRNLVTDKSRPRVGDVLLTKDGSIGRVAVCDRPDVCINQSVALIQPNEEVDSRFLKFLLEAPHYQQRMEGDADGTTIKHIYITRVDKMEVAIPPLEEQRAIAHCLGTLDDKIELNRRMSETLEAMARAAFKSWFVDFDPVRAKAEGRDTGLPTPLADLFPRRLVDSEIGEIPEGWGIATLNDTLEITDGRTLSTEARSGAGTFQAFGANGPIARTAEAWVDSPCIVLGKIGTCGALNRSPAPCWVTNNAFAVRAGKSRSLEFAWHVLSSIDFTNFIGGSANPYMPLKNFGHQQILVPSPDLLERFEIVAGGLRRRVEFGETQSSLLAALRDTLLPSLVSGELRPNAVEHHVERLAP